MFVFGLFFFCNYASGFSCEGSFEKKFEKKYPTMSRWIWSYSTDNSNLFGDLKEYNGRRSIGVAEGNACINSGGCAIEDVVCAVKKNLILLRNEAEDADRPVRLRVISYSMYFSLYEDTVASMDLGKSCELTHKIYYENLSNFWTESLREIGYRVSAVQPFEVNFELKPEYLSDDECFHQVLRVKERIRSLRIPGDPYGLAWARIGFGVSWAGADFFPAFDIEKIEVEK